MNSQVLRHYLYLILSAFCVTEAAGALNYPKTRQTNQVDDYHGAKIADPYRWLEDDNSSETKQWVEAQNKVTFAYLDQIPERNKIKARLTRLWNFERYGIPFKEGGRYFFTRNDGLQNQSILYKVNTLKEPPQLLLDPNKLSPDGTAALGGYDVSEDGQLMAYGIAAAGSDWQEWKVRDVKTAEDLPDQIKWVKFSTASWTKDRQGFFYSRYDQPKPGDQLKGINYFQKLFFHKLGTSQSEDRLIYERKDHKDWGFGGEVTEDGHYLIIHVSQGTDTRSRIFYKDLKKGDGPVVELLNDFDAQYAFIDNDGSRFWFRTDLNAPRGRVIEIDIAKPERSNWKELITQATETLRAATMLNNQFVASYLKDARSQIRIYSRTGEHVRDVDLPGIGTVAGFTGKRKDTETFYSFTSFATPGTIYRYDLKTGMSEIFRRPNVDCDPSQFETSQVFYQSKDGTRIPMFIVHKKGLKLDGSNPTLLYGYGGSWGNLALPQLP